MLEDFCRWLAISIAVILAVLFSIMVATGIIYMIKSLREQAAETLVVRDTWDREREARSQRYFERRDRA
jgi:ABC-type phosphate transport system permease subunit